MNSKKENLKAFSAIVLAAGKGTRMKSPLPKVLHPVAGEPMINNVIRACRNAGAEEIRMVCGHGLNLVKPIVEAQNVKVYIQAQQLGTADAVRAAHPDSMEGTVVIMNGDHPLMEAEDIQGFVSEFHRRKLDLAVVTTELKNPKEFGRVIRHQGQLKAIVEAKDASADTLKIREVNTGIYIATSDILKELLPRIQNQNSKGEFYLTDLIGLAQDGHFAVDGLKGAKRVSFGVNTQQELAMATRLVFRRKAKKLLESGVILLDPLQTYVEDTVQVGPGSVLYPGVFLKGKTQIGSFTVLEPNVFVIDSRIGDSVQIKAGSYIERSQIANKCSVGPYARLRPETVLMDEAHIGNFVELKKVKFGKGSKAGHLTYLGDAEIGERVNIGCGTITCNYAVDKKKYKTIIGNDVFVGSDTQFVAPLTVGDHAVIGSGSTITKDVPARGLAVARGKQFTKENYVKVADELSDAAEDSSKSESES